MNYCMYHVIVVEDDDESLASDKANLSDQDTDSDDEDEGDDEKEEKSEHPDKYNDQKRYSVAGASVAESVQAKAVEKKEVKKQSQVTMDNVIAVTSCFVQFSALDALDKLRHNYCINKVHVTPVHIISLQVHQYVYSYAYY